MADVSEQGKERILLSSLAFRPPPSQSGPRPTVVDNDLKRPSDVLAAFRALQPGLEELLQRTGAILIRRLPVDLSTFSDVTDVIAPERLEYREQSSPRRLVADRIYTSTEYPADQRIPPHNENSYQTRWPTRLIFFCVKAAAIGGETIIADSANVLNRIDAGMRAKFEEKGWILSRTYHPGLEMSWQRAFGTDDKRQVEAHCEAHALEVEWHRGDVLRTLAHRHAVHRHPVSGTDLWFNHILLFHPRSLSEEIRKALFVGLDPELLPNNVLLGDGSLVEDEFIDHLADCYEQETVPVNWSPGDLMLIDNMQMAHGRMAYQGERLLLFSMSGDSGPNRI